MSKKFKVGDRLKAIEFDRSMYGIDFVTITSINEKEKVYHWVAEESENLQISGKIHSGYFFHEAVEYDEDEWGDGEDIDWDVTLLDGLEDENFENFYEKKYTLRNIIKKSIVFLVLFELASLSFFSINLISIEPSWKLFMICNLISLSILLILFILLWFTIRLINNLFD